MKRATVLVTGAGGFVGGTVVEALYFLGELNIRAGIHHWNSAARISRFPIEIVICDVTKPLQLAAALANVDYVIHCAVASDLTVTSKGTANLLEAAIAHGVKRVVHISSVSVYGAASGIVDETTVAPSGTVGPYGLAKLQTEEACREATAMGLEVVVLRPTIIYGPFSALWTVLYSTRLQSGRWADFGSDGEGKCNLVHVHDVVRYAIAALRGPDLAGQAFNINGPEIITWNEYFRAFNAKLGLPPLRSQQIGKTRMAARLTRPVRVLGKVTLRNFLPQLAWLSQKSDLLNRLMQNTELTLRCTPNAEELHMYGFDVIYTMSKAERMFGVRSRVGVSEGLNMTVAWLRHMEAAP